MTEQQALELLGLAGAPSQDEIRRAYLRQVKLHPPERDREGFQRVREAFELLQAPRSSGQDPTERHAELRQWVQDALRSQPGALALEPALSFEAVSEEPLESARRMLVRYESAGSEQWPAPAVCLHAVLLLIELLHVDEARELLQAFDEHAPSALVLDRRVIERWRLARELVGLLEVDELLASALAAGLRSGDLSAAARAARSLRRPDGPIARELEQKFPNVWSRLAPWLEPVEEPVQGAPRRSRWLPLQILLLVQVAFFAFLMLTDDDSSDAQSVVGEERATDRSDEEKSLDAVSASIRTMEAEFMARDWVRMEQALAERDCRAVEIYWSGYRSSHGKLDLLTARERKRAIVRTCPELEQLLEEKQP